VLLKSVRPVGHNRSVPINEDLAWAAGFFDGEGTFSLSGRYSAVHVRQVDPEPLDRFRDALGVGAIDGPYLHQTPGRFSKQRQYGFRTYRRLEVLSIAEQMWPYLGLAKRAQAVRALNGAGIKHDLRIATTTEGSPLLRLSLAWAAGFIDGEGCFSYSRSTEYPCVAITNTERRLLERFRSIVAVGKIYGPYMNRNGVAKKPHFLYRAHGWHHVQAIAAMLWFKLGTAKRNQAIAVIRHRMITCHKGHQKIAGHAGCGICQAEYWQTRRLGKPYKSKAQRGRRVREESVFCDCSDITVFPQRPSDSRASYACLAG
jgi:hypothetical protein